jgi:hypothetical protein
MMMMMMITCLLDPVRLSLSLFYLVCWMLLLLSSSLFKLLLFPLSGSGDKNLVSALVSYTDPMRILSEEGDGQSKKTMGNCCCLGSTFVFLPPPPPSSGRIIPDGTLFVC